MASGLSSPYEAEPFPSPKILDERNKLVLRVVLERAS
jgi:hypothetical protein